MRLHQIAFAMRQQMEGGRAVPGRDAHRARRVRPADDARPRRPAGRRRVPAALQRRHHERPRARSSPCMPRAPGWSPPTPSCRSAPGQALSIGLTSYDGGVYYGLYTDRDAIPDADVLGHAVVDAFRSCSSAPHRRAAVTGRPDGRRAHATDAGSTFRSTTPPSRCSAPGVRSARPRWPPTPSRRRRARRPASDEELLEYAALLGAAAQADGVRPAGGRRVIAAADVEAALVEEVERRGAPTRVEVDAPMPRPAGRVLPPRRDAGGHRRRATCSGTTSPSSTRSSRLGSGARCRHPGRRPHRRVPAPRGPRPAP